MTKFVVAVCSFVALVALVPSSANAANVTCTVTGVDWQKHTPGVPADLLMVNCSDGSGYASYIGRNDEFMSDGCYASADGVKAFESLAVAARLSGKPLSIWWTTRSCPGNAGQKSIDMLGLL